MFSQVLDWGYHARQPPLYTWLVWGTARLAGVSVASLTILKYLVLAVAYGFAWATARRVLAEPALAPLAAFSLLLLLPVGWFVHDDLTQSVAVLAAATGTFYALVRLEATPSLGRYVWLGVGLGLGTLSKLNYLVFAAALAVAALSLAPFRRRLADGRIVATLLVTAALVLPHAVWLGTRDDDLPRLYGQLLQPGGMNSFAAGVLSGLVSLGRSLLYYTAPLGLVLLALFPEVYRGRAATSSGHPAGRLAGRTLIAGVGLLAIGALVGVLGQLKFRWAIPILFLLPLYACWRVDRLPTTPARARRLRAYGGALVLVEGLMIAGILGQTYLGARFGAPSRLNTPYDAAAAALARDGFSRGAIVTGPGALGGNLRVAFPAARVASLETPGFLPPPAADGGACVLAWDHVGGEAVPADLGGWLRARLGVELPAALPVRAVAAPYRHTPGREYRAYYVTLPEGADACR